MRKLISLLLILLVAGAAQALRRQHLRDQRSKAAVERIFKGGTRPGSSARPRRDVETPRSGARARWDAKERQRR